MKNILACLILTLTSIAFADTRTVNCSANGSVDGILHVRVKNSTTAGEVTASIQKAIAGVKTSEIYESIASLDEERILLSQENKGPWGTDLVYLMRSTYGDYIVKVNRCSFAYQEETCPSDEPEAEQSRTAAVCVVAHQ